MRAIQFKYFKTVLSTILLLSYAEASSARDLTLYAKGYETPQQYAQVDHHGIFAMCSIGPAPTPLFIVDPTLLSRQLHRDDNLCVSERHDARTTMGRRPIWTEITQRAQVLAA